MVGGDVAAEPLGSDTSQIDDDGASEYAAEQGGVSEDENLNNDRGGRLGQSRRLGAITDSEMQLLVKWAAEHPGWSSQTGSQRWIPFLEVVSLRSARQLDFLKALTGSCIVVESV